MRNIKYGLPAIHYPPIEQNARALQMYEAAGLDFALFWDNLIVGFPQSIWTPDIVPAAAHYNIDNLFDGFITMAHGAMVTEKLELIMMAIDPFRRAPNVMAQQILGCDHLSKGRASFHFGAGEAKQFEPYGLPRSKPMGHMEEAMKIIRMLIESKGKPVSYEGPIWTLDNALLVCPPYNDACPKLMVVGGPGKPLEIASRLGDGWGAFVPASCQAHSYVDQIKLYEAKLNEQGRKLEDQKRTLVFVSLIEETEEAVDRAIQNLAIRWDVAAFIPNTYTWKEAGFTNPLGDDWSYPSDLISTKWGREDALRIAEAVPPEAVRALRFCGTPRRVAEQIQPYIEAGCDHVCIVNYAGLVGTGEWAAGATGSKVMDETFAYLREMNGQPQPKIKSIN